MTRSISSLHCLPSYDNRLGGSVHAGLNVCKYLAQAGQPVQAVAPYAEGDDVAYLSRNYGEVSCQRVARTFPKRFSNAAALPGWLRANLDRFDVVEIHGIWLLASWQAARCCIERGKPYFIRSHGSLDPFDLQKHALAKHVIGPVYVRWLLNHAAGVICTADLESERLKTFGARVECWTMPLPVPLAEVAGDRMRFRSKHGIPTDATVVLFLSRVDYKKGLEFLIPAIGALKQRHPKLWFVLAGTGTPEFTARIDGLIVAHQIKAFTSVVGFVSGQDKLDAFAAADTFALPSLNENFGLVIVEAMHAALPLLISDEVYIHPEIERAGAGVVCRPTLESVAEKLSIMLSGAINLNKMGCIGRNLVHSHYRPEVATTALLKLYTDTLEKAVDR
ncbi:MAG: hypothetical protein RLZZ129_2238 [Verrucomicrobiota bacterium]|jgi:glycosyltransferase involved in cell wall biosynthesis